MVLGSEWDRSTATLPAHILAKECLPVGTEEDYVENDKRKEQKRMKSSFCTVKADAYFLKQPSRVVSGGAELSGNIFVNAHESAICWSVLTCIVITGSAMKMIFPNQIIDHEVHFAHEITLDALSDLVHSISESVSKSSRPVGCLLAG